VIRFVDRESELQILSECWERQSADLVVLYGRRRIGKTTLLDKFFSDKEGIFYVATDVYVGLQIQDVKISFAKYFGDNFLLNVNISDWSELFQYLEKIVPSNKRFYIVLDEFTYLTRNDRTILSSLQRAWDLFFSKTQVLLVICGSDLGMMQDNVLSYSSPLYGRRTRDILLTQFDLRNSLKFTSYDFEEGLMLYMTIGGVPEYLEKAQGYNDYYAFVIREFGEKNGFFYREPYYLLAQEFRDYNIYFSIINAISFGKVKPSEIADFVGIEGRRIYPYLETLQRLGFVIRIRPVLDNRNKGIYHLSDRMLRFWFNYVFPWREYTERGGSHTEFDFETYFGHVFEEVIRNDIYSHMYPGYEVGTWWYKQDEIDLVAISPDRNKLIAVECKWRDNQDPSQLVAPLKGKVGRLQKLFDFEEIELHIVAKSFIAHKEINGAKLFDLTRLRKMILGKESLPSNR